MGAECNGGSGRWETPALEQVPCQKQVQAKYGAATDPLPHLRAVRMRDRRHFIWPAASLRRRGRGDLRTKTGLRCESPTGCRPRKWWPPATGRMLTGIVVTLGGSAESLAERGNGEADKGKRRPDSDRRFEKPFENGLTGRWEQTEDLPFAQGGLG